MENVVSEEKLEFRGYNLKAFFFSFAYYFYMRQWVFGIIAFLLTIILPFQMYFAISFIESMVLWRRNSKNKSLRSPWKKWGIIVACLSVFLCVIGKYWFYKALAFI